MIIKRFSSPNILSSIHLAGFVAKTKSGAPRKLDQKLDRLSFGTTATELKKGMREMRGGLLGAIKNGGEN